MYGEKACRDNPEDLTPIQEWETPFAQVHGDLEGSEFKLGCFTPKGATKEVDTLEYVIAHLDITTACGCSGWSYELLRSLPNTEFLRPVIELFFGVDKESTFDDNDPYQRAVHGALISCRGMALNKSAPGEKVKVRPIGLPEAFAQIACLCYLTQSTNDWSPRLLKDSAQLGLEPNGTLLAYQRISRSLEALIAMDRPAGVNISDMGGAYNRILRTSLQRGIIE